MFGSPPVAVFWLVIHVHDSYVYEGMRSESFKFGARNLMAFIISSLFGVLFGMVLRYMR